jgi:hypothetical protein
MVNDKKINIEVAYAVSETQCIIKLVVHEGCSIELAIDRSGILLEFPEIDLMKQKVGIFSKQKKLSDMVHEGDRIDIYRLLMIDPKEARRKRVKKS